jgi:hypothetical protein
MNLNSKPQWSQEQTTFLLEYYAEMKEDGLLMTEKPVTMRRVFTELGELLEEKFPPTKFDWLWVQRYIQKLVRNYKAFLLMLTYSGASYNETSGRIETSPENWAYFLEKYGAAALSLKSRGLYYRELFERAFDTIREAGRTCCEATDRAGLAQLREASVESDDPFAEESYSQAPAEDHHERERIPSTPSTAGQYPSQSSPTGHPVRPHNSSDSSSLTRERRPHRAAPTSRISPMDRALKNFVDLQYIMRRPIGADDLQRAIEDVQMRFSKILVDGEPLIEGFIDWLLSDPAEVIRYNSSNSLYKRRLFYQKMKLARRDIPDDI